MMHPSINWCGSRSINARSLNVPGSPSSALITRYRGSVPAGRNPHLTPAGNPAPPRPRRFAAFTSATISAGCIVNTAFRAARYPPRCS